MAEVNTRIARAVAARKYFLYKKTGKPMANLEAREIAWLEDLFGSSRREGYIEVLPDDLEKPQNVLEAIVAMAARHNELGPLVVDPVDVEVIRAPADNLFRTLTKAYSSLFAEVCEEPLNSQPSVVNTGAAGIVPGAPVTQTIVTPAATYGQALGLFIGVTGGDQTPGGSYAVTISCSNPKALSRLYETAAAFPIVAPVIATPIQFDIKNMTKEQVPLLFLNNVADPSNKLYPHTAILGPTVGYTLVWTQAPQNASITVRPLVAGDRLANIIGGIAQ